MLMIDAFAATNYNNDDGDDADCIGSDGLVGAFFDRENNRSLGGIAPLIPLLFSLREDRI